MQGDKSDAQTIEVDINHIFRKKTSVFFDSSNNIQKKMCNFVIRCKRAENEWVEFNEEYDFS